jgi:hypothetical protein
MHPCEGQSEPAGTSDDAGRAALALAAAAVPEGDQDVAMTDDVGPRRRVGLWAAFRCRRLYDLCGTREQSTKSIA